MKLNPLPVMDINDPLPLIIEDLTPAAIATLTLTVTDAAGTHFESTTQFRADDGGVINLTTALPVHAEWHAPASLGPIWSLRAHNPATPFTPADELHFTAKVRCEGKGQGLTITRRFKPTTPTGPRVLAVAAPTVQPLIVHGFDAHTVARDPQAIIDTVEGDTTLIAFGQDAALALELAEAGVVNAVILHSPQGPLPQCPSAPGPILVTGSELDTNVQAVRVAVPAAEVHILTYSGTPDAVGFPYTQPGHPILHSRNGSVEDNGRAAVRTQQATLSFMESYYS